MQVRPYLQIMLVAPAYFLLDYGPMVVFAGWYLIAERKRGLRKELLPVLALGLCSLLFIFFVRHNFETNVGLRKGMKTLQIPLLVLSGLFFETVYLQAKARPIVKNVVRALVLVAVPTLGVDIYSASTVTNEGNTSFVNAADYEACAWLKRHTPIDAVIQSEPEYPSVYRYSLISCFAERTMVVGQSHLGKTLHMLDGQAFSEGRKLDVRRMLATSDVAEALTLIRKYGINYVYVGSLEKKLYLEGAAKFGLARGSFRKVYRRARSPSIRSSPPRAGSRR